MKYALTLLSALLLLGLCPSCLSLKVDYRQTNLQGLLPAAHIADTLSPGTSQELSIGKKTWKEVFAADPLLQAHIEATLAANFDLQIAEQRIMAARAATMDAAAWLAPQVQIASGAGIRKFGDYTMDGIGNFDTNFSPNLTPDQQIARHLPDYTLGLQSSWEADIWGKLKSRKGAALMRALAAEESRNLLITNLVTETATAYYELLAADEEIRVIEEMIRLQEEAYRVILVQKRAGVANELAVKQFEAQMFYAKSLIFEIRQRIREAENRLNFLMSAQGKTIARDSTAFSGEPGLPFAGTPEELLQNRPDIRAAEKELAAASKELYATRADFYPTLSLSGNLGVQSFSTRFLLSLPASLAYSAFANAALPILNRRALKARYGYAKALEIEAGYRYQQTVLNAVLEMSNRLSEMHNLSNTIGLRAQESEALRKAIESSVLLFNAGNAGYLEVIYVQDQALRTQLELIGLRKRQWYAFINTYRAAGGGWR